MDARTVSLSPGVYCSTPVFPGPKGARRNNVPIAIHSFIPQIIRVNPVPCLLPFSALERNCYGSWDADITWPQGAAKHWDASSLKRHLRMLGFSAPSFHWQVAKLGFPFPKPCERYCWLTDPLEGAALLSSCYNYPLTVSFQGSVSCSFPMI